MGISPVELSVQRALTKAFIRADEKEVVLSRRARVDDGAGGIVLGDAVPLAPQLLRLIPLGDGAQERLTADGKSVTPSYMLMGEHTADMQRGDTFTVNGRRYELVFVNENRQYEIKAEVVYRGE